MSIDNTHTKYLKGTDKKAWNDFKAAYDAQQKMDKFIQGFNLPKEIKDGEEYEIPVNKKRTNIKNNN